MTDKTTPPIVPTEGLHVLHLFYKVEHGQWQIFTEQEKIRAKTRLAELVQEIRSAPDTQLLSFALVTPKADLGFMLVTPDLQAANAWEKQLSLALGADVLAPVPTFIQDPINGRFSVYLLGDIRPATRQECVGLERCAK